MHLHTGDFILLGMTVLLILLPSQLSEAGNLIGRTVDRLRGIPPEESTKD
jgi:Sec-independent protein translocase protein TatA